MPELPEVETVRRGLAPVLVGQTITAVRLARQDLRFALPKDFAARLEGRRIIELARRAKYLIARLDSGDALLMHLGMTGRFTVVVPDDGRAVTIGELYYEPTPRKRPRPRRVRDRGRPPHRLQRCPPLRHHGHYSSGRRAPPAAGATRRRTARRGVRRGASEPRLSRQARAAQGGAARPAHHRRSRQHICVRGALSGETVAAAARRHARPAAQSPTGASSAW
jgi:hypothetical protein